MVCLPGREKVNGSNSSNVGNDFSFPMRDRTIRKTLIASGHKTNFKICFLFVL